MNTILRAALPLLILTLPASAQWSSDPAVNFSVGDGTGDQVQSKIAPTSDGGCYLSWFDSIGNGFDVRLQRLDAAGNELWAHNGVLVADRGFSSTQDYGLDVDSAGNALLAFRDNTSGEQIHVAKVSPAGALLWGLNGIALTSTSDFVGSPRVAGTSDGHAVVAWTQNSDTRLQRLDAAGALQWGAGVIVTPPAGNYWASDLHDSGTDVILAMVHQTGAQFWTPKHLKAQKFDSAGATLWGATPVAVFDADSLQVGNFPSFVTDGAGGAVFGWYGTGPLQCYAQHLLANGAEAFPHNGSAGSTNAAQIRTGPSVSYDASTASTYLFWQEANSGQSQYGLGGQRFDGIGARQWGSSGATLLPLSSTFISGVSSATSGGGAFVFWNESPAFGQDVLKGAHLDGAGATDIGPFDVASTTSNKLRLSARTSSTGQILLTWGDERIDSGDILAQNVNPDGSLGNGAGAGTGYCFGTACPCGNGDSNAGCANSTGSGGLLTGQGSASAAADDLRPTLSGVPAGRPALLFAGTNALAGAPFGDGMRCAGGTIKRLGTRTADGSGSASWGPGIATAQGWVAGDLRNFQVWYRDPTGPCSAGFNTTNGLAVTYLP